MNHVNESLKINIFCQDFIKNVFIIERVELMKKHWKQYLES